MKYYRISFIVSLMLAGVLFFTQTNIVTACTDVFGLPHDPPITIFNRPELPIHIGDTRHPVTILIGTVIEISGQHTHLYENGTIIVESDGLYSATIEVGRYLTDDGPPTITMEDFGFTIPNEDFGGGSCAGMNEFRPIFVHPGERYVFRVALADNGIALRDPYYRHFNPTEQDVDEITRIISLADAPYIMTIPYRIRYWVLYESRWHDVRKLAFGLALLAIIGFPLYIFKRRRRTKKKRVY